MTQQELPPVAPAPYAYPAYPTANDRDRALPPPSTTAATWALTFAVIPIPLANIIAIFQAIGVLRKCRDGRNYGRGQAIAALVIAPVWLLVVMLAIGASLDDGAGRGQAGVTQRGDVSVFALQEGDCLISAIPEDVRTRTVEVGPCSGPHEAEVYAAFDLADGPYPGRAQAIRLAEGGCTKRLAESTRADRDSPDAEVTYFYPEAVSWRTEKGVLCMIGSTPKTA